MKELIFWTILSYIQDNWREIISRLFWWIFAFIVIYAIIKYIVHKVKSKIEWNSLNTDIYTKKNAKLVWWILFIVLMIFNILATFEIIGFDVAIIMWWISLSIWFAMENTIWNLVSWILILTNKKVKLGDFVEFLWSLKILWIIEEVNVRYTVVRSFDRRRTIIPNSIIAKTPIRTLKSEPILKWEITIPLSRTIFFEKVKDIFKKVIYENENIIYPEYSTLFIENFTPRGITTKWFFYVNTEKKLPFSVAKEIRKKLFEEMKKNNIHFPYPHTTISVE